MRRFVATSLALVLLATAGTTFAGTTPKPLNVPVVYFDTYRAAIVIVGDWEKVKDQVTPFGDVTMYDAEGKIAPK